MDLVAQSALYSLAPVAGMVAGGAAAAWWQPGGRVRSYIQHFAAGVVFAAVGVEILPDIIRRRSPLPAGIGFALGVAAMLAIRAMSRRAESSAERSAAGRTPWALVAAIAVDLFVDGMLIGVGFAAGERQGVLLAVALTGCTVALGLATAAALLRAGGARLHAAALTA